MFRKSWFVLLLPLACFSQLNEEEALFVRRIADFWQEEEYAIAKDQIEEFLALYPESAYGDPMRAALGDIFLREKEYTAALKCYSKISNLELIETIFFNQMQCLYHLGWHAALADECETRLKTKELPTDQKLEITYFLAIALYHECLNASKDPEKLEKIAKRAEPYFETLFNSAFSKRIAPAFAHLLCLLKEYPKASEIYFDLSQTSPGQEEEMLFQAALIQVNYNKIEALETFQKIAQKEGKHSQESFYNWLILSFELKQFDKILEKEEALLKQIPEGKLPLAKLFLAKSFLQQKEYPKSLKLLTALVNEAQEKEILHSALSTLLESSFQSEDFEAFDLALSNLKNNFPGDLEIPKALFSRAQMLKKAAKEEEAKQSLEELVETYPDALQKPQTLFELTHLAYKKEDWPSCKKWAQSFLSEFEAHELAPFIWRYLATAAAELSEKDPESKEQLARVLNEILQKKDFFSQKERLEWEFLLAKIHFELKNYRKSMEILEGLLSLEEPFSDRANALLLFGLCYRDGMDDFDSFISYAEQALLENPNLVDRGELHASLFNAYLQKSDLDPNLMQLASEHLFQAYLSKSKIQEKNLLWLADLYFEQLEGSDPTLFAKRVVSLLEKWIDRKNLGLFEKEVVQLAKAYAVLGRADEEISLLESLREEQLTHPEHSWRFAKEAELLLAEGYILKGEEAKGESLLNQIIAKNKNVRTFPSASASIQRARIQIRKFLKNGLPFTSPEWKQVLAQLKDLVIQKYLPNEPLHLEAAIEYVELLSQMDGSKRKTLSLWEKIKNDFEKSDDLLAKDYHKGLEELPQKRAIFQNYMQFMEAEILFAKADLEKNGEMQKELQAKGKGLLLTIIDQKPHPALRERVEKRLEMLSAK